VRKTESGPKGLREKCDMRCGILREEEDKETKRQKEKKMYDLKP